MLSIKEENKYLILIWVLSIGVPVAVAVLLFMPYRLGLGSEWINLLPHLNAALNSTTAVVLMIGLVFIKSKKIEYHKYAMLIAFTLGSLFLLSYIIYHSSAPNTIFGDINGDGTLGEHELAELGIVRPIYLTILISHILLAAIVVPLVLLAVYFALNNKFVKHKRIVKFAFPVWLYVSVTGVIVYLLISPYY